MDGMLEANENDKSLHGSQDFRFSMALVKTITEESSKHISLLNLIRTNTF